MILIPFHICKTIANTHLQTQQEIYQKIYQNTHLQTHICKHNHEIYQKIAKTNYYKDRIFIPKQIHDSHQLQI